MNYRIQDFMKLIIPGMYVVAFIVGWYMLTYGKKNNVIELKDFVPIILLFIPFVGFVVGYFVECLMAVSEHLIYQIGFRRPSKTVLSGSLMLYVLATQDKIRSKHNARPTLTNAKAGEILQIAKQNIDQEKVENFRLNSVLSRNIFGGQFLLTIAYVFVSNCFYKDTIFYLSLIVVLLFFIYWLHQTHVYVKYVLAEYGKTLN